MGGYENLGPVVSQNPQAVTPGGGNFSADERSYDSLVFQQNCPPMDWEMNLLQSVVGNSGVRRLAANLYSSTFISSDVLENDKPGETGSSYTFLPAVVGNENLFEFKACDILINGWNIHFEYSGTNTAGTNVINLGSPPLFPFRVDLVIIEVWRALLSPLPSTDNKSPAGNVLRFGNAKAPDPPFNVNLADDLLDPTYLAETSRRVQIQYRYRVIQGVNLTTYPDGLDDPSVFVNTIPYYTSLSVDGNSLGVNYSPSPTDPGLWVYGNGDAASATAIGSVDGYIYAIPLCAVYRRNNNGFNKATNLSGGVLIASGSSDRPDGLYADQIIGSDVIDLRKVTAFSPIDFRNNAINAILQNKLTTQLEINISQNGGNTFLTNDRIGSSAHIGDADGVRMTFSDRPTTQSIPLTVTGIAVDTVVIDLSSVDLPWAAGTNILATSPAGTDLLQISKIYVQDTPNSIYDALDVASINPVVSITYSVTGVVIDTATIVFTVNLNPGDRLYLEALLSYPKNSGLARNVTDLYSVWVPNAIVGPGPTNADPTAFSATSDPTRLSLNLPYYDYSRVHREVNFTLPTPLLVGVSLPCLTTNSFIIPDMVDPDPSSIVLAVGAVTSVQTNAGCTLVTFNPPVVLPATVTVDYIAYRAPLALTPGNTIEVFSDTRAIQSIQVPAGNVTIPLYKRTDLERMWLVNNSSGNIFDNQLDSGSQIPISQLPTSSFSDSRIPVNEISTPLSIISTGVSKNPVLSNSFDSTNSFTISSLAISVTQDADSRNFWPYSSGLSISCSNLLPYTTAIPRKVCSDFVVQLASDTPFYGKKGTLFLAIANKFSTDNIGNINPQNQITSSSVSPLDGISLYRLRGNPIYYRRTP